MAVQSCCRHVGLSLRAPASHCGTFSTCTGFSLWDFLCVHRLLIVGLSLRAPASHCSGFSCCEAWALGCVGSAVAVHWLSCSVACAVFPDEDLNLCPLNWQGDSLPLDHQGSPELLFFYQFYIVTLISYNFTSEYPMASLTQLE